MKRPSIRPAVLCASVLFALTANAQSWESRLAGELPLMGHRNWILVVDSAYPQQVGSGIETIETDADQLEVVRTVLSAVQKSIHVRPVIFMDAELGFVGDKEAPGVSNYRTQINALLHDYDLHSRLHQSLIDELAKDGALYHVLILKTKLAIPYTSVFIHLDCKYWSTDSERALREAMSARGGQ
jgi:L-fucose mutarotase/ribose pyranase (RbsD/FucU family)